MLIFLDFIAQTVVERYGLIETATDYFLWKYYYGDIVW